MSELEEIIEVMNRIYWSQRYKKNGEGPYIYLRGSWMNADFTSYDYDDGDAKNAVNEIAKILRGLATTARSEK